MTKIRNATRKDAPDIARVYVDSWRESYAGMIPDWVLLGMSYRRLTRAWERAIRTAGKDEAILVAEAPGHGVVGLGSCGPSRDRSLTFGGEVYTLYVHPDHVGQGVGSELLKALFTHLEMSGNPSAVIWALAENPARHFYHAQGGTIAATRQGRQWGIALNEIAYGWQDVKVFGAGPAGNKTSDKSGK
jgi:ribosomal protein S18 acetylase RimI-like enzyme